MNLVEDDEFFAGTAIYRYKSDGQTGLRMLKFEQSKDNICTAIRERFYKNNIAAEVIDKYSCFLENDVLNKPNISDYNAKRMINYIGKHPSFVLEYLKKHVRLLTDKKADDTLVFYSQDIMSRIFESKYDVAKDEELIVAKDSLTKEELTTMAKIKCSEDKTYDESRQRIYDYFMAIVLKYYSLDSHYSASYREKIDIFVRRGGFVFSYFSNIKNSVARNALAVTCKNVFDKKVTQSELSAVVYKQKCRLWDGQRRA